MTGAIEPSSAEHQDIDEAIIVVVGVDDIETACFSDESGFDGPIAERAVTNIPIQAKLAVGVPGGNHDIEQSVVVEIVHHDAAGQIVGGESDGAGYVWKALNVVVGFENLRVDEPLSWDARRIFPERHVSDVEEPAGAEIVRIALEQRRESGNGGA